MQGAEQITQQLEAAGFRARFLPISAMEEIREHYAALPRRGPDTQWLRGAIDHFRGSQPPALDFEPKSILVIACPCVGATLALHRKGRRIEIPIAPAYVSISPLKNRLEEVLAGAARGYRLENAKGFSQKLQAALSGLGQYGRNNICYVGDWGSYAWLETRYTDVPHEGAVRTRLRMEACETCDLCRKACPTGAIGESQVIDASRCLAMRNESRKRMPRWVPKGAHHTLSGCLRCQECCPQNPAIDFSHTLELDKKEAGKLLSCSRRLPKELEEKLAAFGCEKWTMSVLKRNAKLAAKNL